MTEKQENLIIGEMREIHSLIETLEFPLSKEKLAYFLQMIYGKVSALLFQLPMENGERIEKLKELVDYITKQLGKKLSMEKYCMIIGNIQCRVGNGLSHHTEPPQSTIPKQKTPELKGDKEVLPTKKHYNLTGKYSKKAKKDTNESTHTTPIPKKTENISNKILKIPDPEPHETLMHKEMDISPILPQKQNETIVKTAMKDHIIPFANKHKPIALSRKRKEELQRNKLVICDKEQPPILINNGINDTDFVSHSDREVKPKYQQIHASNKAEYIPMPSMKTTPNPPHVVQSIKAEPQPIKDGRWYADLIIDELKTSKDGLSIRDMIDILDIDSRNLFTEAIESLCEQNIIQLIKVDGEKAVYCLKI